MDFRNYDPAIGRFHSPDPLGELTPDWTPYRFAFNNPVFFSDPTGLYEDDGWVKDKESKEIYWDPDVNSANEVKPGQEWVDYGTLAQGSDGNLYELGEEGALLDALIKLEEAIITHESWNPYDNANVAAAARGLYEAQSKSAAVQDMDAWIKSGISWIPGAGLVYLPEMMTAFQNGNYVDGGVYALGALPGGFGKVGGKGVSKIIAGKYTTTKTVANNLTSRPYINSPSTISNIMQSSKGVPDAYFKGGMNYKASGTFNGSSGVFELGINPETNTIYHFLFTSSK